MDNNASTRHTGGCDCGAVRYQVTGKLRDVIACHCVQCRRLSGHYTAATAAPPRALQLLQTSGLKWYRASPATERGFCGICGSTLFWRPASGDRISIYAGSLDDSSGLHLTAHIYTAEKGAYYTITPDDGQTLHEGTAAMLTITSQNLEQS